MQLLSNDIIRAIGWTLIHSLWQGLILALVAGILILFTRKAKPALRYNIFTSLFFVLVGSAVLTFFYELNRQETPAIQTATPADQAALPPAFMPEVQVAPQQAITTPQADFSTRFVAYFNEHAPLMVMLWFIVFVARSLWLFGGLVYIQRIRHYKTSTPNEQLLDKLEELCRRLRLNSKVQLLESALVKVPTALGWLKPVVLMPLGMMAQLPADQVEAVLLHELAHIRRRDFLVNLIQHFAETVFFFNPALLWLSARIREEREHCCDDMAIAVTQSRGGYVKALVSFQELQLTPHTKYAMAFPGKKKQLLHRVKRILGSNNKSLNMAEKSFLLLCFSLIGILGFVFSQPEKKQEPKQPAVEQVTTMDQQSTAQENNGTDSVAPEQAQEPEQTPGPEEPLSAVEAASLPDRDTSTAALQAKKDFYQQPYVPAYQPWQPKKDSVPVLRKGNSVMSGTITVNNGQYKITIDNNKATGLTIDGVKVPDDQLPSKYDLISSIFRKMERDDNSILQEKLLRDQLTIDSQNQLTLRQQKLDAESAALHQQKLDAESATLHQQKLNAESATLYQQKIMAERDALAATPPANPAPMATPAPNVHVQTPPNAARVQPAPRPVATPTPQLTNEADKIIAELFKDGLITQKDSLSFQLNQDGLTVNGKKQPESITRKYKEKYVKQSTDSYTYLKSGNHTTTHINIGN